MLRKGPPVKKALVPVPVTLELAAQKAGELIAAVEKEEIEEAKQAQRRIPSTTMRIFERKYLWAWIHQAPDNVLRELYATAADRHGLAELGEMLRQYLTMRAYFPNNPLAVERCPFCKVTSEVTQSKMPAKKMPGKK